MTAKLNKSCLGPQKVLFDMWHGQGWDISMHGGVVTYPHNDASGLGTWGYPTSGSKVWGIIRICSENMPNDREKLFEVYNKVFNESWKAIGSQVLIGTILIEDGDVL